MSHKPRILFHATPSFNRQSILEQGLLARDTTEHTYPYALDNAGVRCVFGQTCPQGAMNAAQYTADTHGLDARTIDVWRVYVKDLPLSEDPYTGAWAWKDSWRVEADVEPDRLALHHEGLDIYE